MSIRRVLKYGEKSLREPSKEVHKVSKKITDLVRDLLDTLYAQNGVGLAAPQIGENVRVFVIDVATNNEPLNTIVFINQNRLCKSKFLYTICNSFYLFFWMFLCILLVRF